MPADIDWWWRTVPVTLDWIAVYPMLSFAVPRWVAALFAFDAAMGVLTFAVWRMQPRS